MPSWSRPFLTGVLTDVFEHFASGHPRGCRGRRNCPTAGPGRGVRTWIVDRYFVRKRSEIGPGNALGKMEFVGRGIAAGEPLLFVEADCVNDERVTFPFAHGVSQVRRTQRIACRMRPSIHIDHSPGMRASDIQD